MMQSQTSEARNTHSATVKRGQYFYAGGIGGVKCGAIPTTSPFANRRAVAIEGDESARGGKVPAGAIELAWWSDESESNSNYYGYVKHADFRTEIERYRIHESGRGFVLDDEAEEDRKNERRAHGLLV